MKPHIVTAFHDIGWKGLPGTDERSVPWYLERFKPLAQLDNPMTVYTSEALQPEIEKLLEGREAFTNIAVLPEGVVQYFIQEITAKYEGKKVQDPLTIPYIALMWLKARFVADVAFKYSYADHTAWVDFAGLRWYGKVEQTPSLPRSWDYDFSNDVATFLNPVGGFPAVCGLYLQFLLKQPLIFLLMGRIPSLGKTELFTTMNMYGVISLKKN